MLVFAKIKWKKKSCIERLCLRYYSSHKAIISSKLAAEAQEYGVKTVKPKNEDPRKASMSFWCLYC